jgi:hypothetical protein
MFASKARAYPREASFSPLLSGRLLALPASIKLSWNTCQGQTLYLITNISRLGAIESFIAMGPDHLRVESIKVTKIVITKWNKFTIYSWTNFFLILVYFIWRPWIKYTRDNIHNTSFSFQLMNGPNKLVCYITLDWKTEYW